MEHEVTRPRRAWGAVLAWARGGLNQSAAARATGWSRSKQCQLEADRAGLSVDDLLDHIRALRSAEASRLHRLPELGVEDLAQLAELAAVFEAPAAPAWAEPGAWRAEHLRHALEERYLQLRAEDLRRRLER